MAAVVVERRERGGETVVGVRAVADGVVLHATVGVGVAGAALALVEAYRTATAAGHRVVGERVVRERRRRAA